MKQMTHVLILDVGTMSLRATVYNGRGKPLYTSAYEYSATFRPPGLVEQDPSDWRIGLLSTLSAVGAYLQSHSVNLVCMAVTSQRASVIPLDSFGYPLHPAVTWQDKRSASQAQQLIDELGFHTLYSITGLRANPYFSLPKMMWFKQAEPEIYARTYKFLGVQDYVVYLLTGKIVTDWTQAARTMLLDIRTFTWDAAIFEASGIREDQLPELIPPGGFVEGGVRHSIATAVGLPEGLPVVVAGGDQQCAALALNVLAPGHAEANTGTGSFCIAHAEHPSFHPDATVLCSASAVPGQWINEAGIFNTGAIYRWLRDLHGGAPSLTYQGLNAAAEEAPVGSNGVVLLPHFEGSAAPHWNDLAKGVFFNLSIGTTLGDVARAVLEGIALEITDNIGIIEAMTGPIAELSVAGGMARSDLFNQIQADSADRRVVRYPNSEATSLGALISSLVTLGVEPNHATAFSHVVTGEPKAFSPIDGNVEVYKQVQKRRDSLYDALAGGQVYEGFQSALV